MPQTHGVELLPAEIGRPSTPQGAIVRRLRRLWEKRRLLTRAVAAGLVIGTLVAFLIPQRFDSQTQLMPPDQQSTSGMGLGALAAASGGALSPIAGNLLGLKSSGALFIGILRSRTVEDRVIDRFQLKQVYRSGLEEQARRQLEENTSIAEDRKSGILTLTVSDRDPKRAAAMAQAYVEELDHLVSEVSTSAAHRERVFLEERLRSVKQELDQAARNFSQFESTSATLDIKEQGRAMFDAAATLSGQLIAAESELKGLEAVYTPNNVRVQAVQARIAELRRQLVKMGGAEEMSATRAAGDSTYPSIRKLPLLGVTYSDLYRQTKIKEVVYETLTQQYELAKVQEAKETPTVKVLDAAKIPERKSFPPRLEIIILCAALSLLGASAVVLGEAHWQVIDADSPGKTLAVEVLHTVQARMPWATPNGSRFQAVTHRVWTTFSHSKK
jgi:capsule polysaccharide export protein KpsE/RkpR